MTDRRTTVATLVATCDNRPEPAGEPCPGHLRYRWGQSEVACDRCGARCGIAVARWLAVAHRPCARE